MLVQVVTYTFPPERADEAERLLRELGAASRAEAGCAGFDVVRGEDGATFVLYEQWRDAAALEEHFATEHFKRLGAAGFRTFALSRTAVKGRPL